jgi:hypothetical protein
VTELEFVWPSVHVRLVRVAVGFSWVRRGDVRGYAVGATSKTPALVTCLALSAALALAGVGVADPVPARSPNWSGYAVTGPGGVGVAFTSVTGTWVTPAVTCPGAAGTTAAVWVGIGGFSGGGEVEQVGTNADCTTSLKALYHAWFEIAPFPAYPIKARVRSGDVITGSVIVLPRAVELRVSDRTRNWTFTRTITSVSPDTSSAEWIVEPPANCTGYSCVQAPLAKFDSVRMTEIAATGNSTSDSLAGTTWTVVPIELVPKQLSPAGSAGNQMDDGSSNPIEQLTATPVWTPGALPGPISADGTSFTVSWIAAPVGG